MAKHYLGDSVYVENIGHGMLRLTTENGFGPTNTIMLEREIIQQLVVFADHVFKGEKS